jgi:phage/plasmid-associated DNA primase
MKPPGSYFIGGDKLDDFYQLYDKALSETNYSISEKHREISPILIDFDFRQNDIKRRYNKSIIIEIVHEFMIFLTEYFELDVDTEIFVLEKLPRPYKEYFKDGIHIIIPTIITRPEYQYKMREVTMPIIENILNDCNFTNKIEDIYDKAVIEKNNWFVYGSKKPDEPHPWKLSYILNWNTDSKELIEIKCSYSNFELINLFSLRNKYEEAVILKELPRIVKVKPSVAQSEPSKSIKTIPIEFDIIKELVYILDPKRADQYQEWINIGWCLHNISNDLLDIWIEFSKQSTKYEDGECDKLWNDMKSHGLGIGSLHYWAKTDNISAYKNIISKSVFNDIKNCDGSHRSIADITYKILKQKYVCASGDGKLWYQFDGNLWKIDNSALKIRDDLAITISNHFINVMNKLALNSSDDSVSSISTNADKIKKDCERLLKISFKLRDSSFKDNLLKEMRGIFYNEEFLNKLDDNPNLIGFNNGVYCLKEGNFRSAYPEDYISYSVGYDYLYEINEEYRSKVIQYFEKLHPDENQRKYVLLMLSKQLYGDTGNELFHIHAGHNASASNGKTIHFSILELCFRDYILKIPVEIFVVKQRAEASKPKPEMSLWRAKRILYCTEPNNDDRLNSGILKELTGGEIISYRMLYSNDIHKFKPMYKIAIMCNDAPLVEGGDEGIKRRIRKIDYISKFVDADQVDETNHYYQKDPNFIQQFKENDSLKMEFARHILEYYDHNYRYEMPDIIKKSSTMYLEENNNVYNFVKEFIVLDKDGFFTLKEAKELFKNSQHFNGKITTLKNELQKVLKIQCIERKKIKGKDIYFIFMGYNFKSNISDENDDLEIENING